MPTDGKPFWDRSAGRYDLSMWLFGGPIKPMCDLVTAEVGGQERVLELAAGTGLVTQAVAPVVGSLVATDYSQPMVDQLDNRVRQLGLNNVQTSALDLYELEDNDGFDAIIAANVLHLLPDIDAALSKMKGALRPGGVLVTPTFCHDETQLARLVSTVLGWFGFPGQRRFTLASLVALLQQHGFEIRKQKLLPGLLPIGFVSATLPTSPTKTPSPEGT